MTMDSKVFYFHASDDRTDFFRLTGTGPVEQRIESVDPSNFVWAPVPDGYFATWGIELVPLPNVKNESGLRLLG